MVLLPTTTRCASQASADETICQLFIKHPNWLWAAEKAQDHWHVPISELMAIIYQESHFAEHAAPKRLMLWHYIPWTRKTSAFGYAQATNATWQLYCQNRGRLSADRSDFADAVDFVGWYASFAHEKLHIAKNDTYNIYLAYHEGINGYKSRSYQNKHWLTHVAGKVSQHKQQYHQQLMQCLHHLPKKPWWF